jgi:hypothetical protein
MTSSRGDWAKSDCATNIVASASNPTRCRDNRKLVAADVRRLGLRREVEFGMRRGRIRNSPCWLLESGGSWAEGRYWQAAEPFWWGNWKSDRLRVITRSFQGGGMLLNPKVGRAVRPSERMTAPAAGKIRPRLLLRKHGKSIQVKFTMSLRRLWEKSSCLLAPARPKSLSIPRADSRCCETGARTALSART